MARPAEEMLYLAMEDFRVDVIVGKGPGATAIPLEIPPFTLVGATTRAGLLPGPLRDRFGFTAQLDFYAAAELSASSAARPACSASTARRRRATRSRGARAAPRASPTGCCAGSATSPRCGPTESSTLRRAPGLGAVRGRRARPRPARPRGCSTRCAAGSAGARSGCARWRSPWARSARPSRRWPSRSWSGRVCWRAPRAAGSPPLPPGRTWG